MKKILITLVYLTLLTWVNAQNNTIDVEKANLNLSFSILRDTISLGKQLFVSYGDSRSKIGEFLDNSINNKPSVHISSDDNYYYNSYALSLLYKNKIKIKSNGFEFLTPLDFENNSFVIENQTLNSGTGKLIKNIKTNSKIGSIFTNAENTIDKTELYFRIPKFNTEKCIESSFDVYSSNVIKADFSKNTISEMKRPEESFGKCTDGYAILMKETIDHYLKQDNLDYFKIMPDVVSNEFREQLLWTLKNQSFSKNKNSKMFILKSSFSNTGIHKIEIDGLNNDFSLMKKIESVTNKYCIIPSYESNYINASFSMPIVYANNGTSLNRHSVEKIQSVFKVDVLTPIDKFNDPSLLKEVVLYREMNVNINLNGERYFHNAISILKMQKPSYLISLKSLFGSGVNKKSKLANYTKWIIPLTGLMAVGTHLISANRYDFYVSNLNTVNNIKVYKTADTFHKASLVITGLYFLTTSIQLTFSIKDVKNRREKVEVFNLKYPQGVNITIP
jgi:hypothetical protein